MLQTYTPSGRFGSLVLFLALLAAAAGVGLAWVYQWLIGLIPFIYLNVLLTIGLGFAVGGAVVMAINLGKCRNVTIGILVSLVAGLLSVGAGHRRGAVVGRALRCSSSTMLSVALTRRRALISTILRLPAHP